jgi:RNA polymerase sigma-70 factor (ECF subfamily)
MQRFQYDPSRSFRGWLRTVSYRVLQDWRADTADEPRASGDSVIHQLLASAEAHDDFAKRIEAEYAHELLSVAMLRVRGRVQPQTWAAFYQTAVEGRRPADVAGDLNLSLANLFVYRSRVRKMLLDELVQLDPDPETQTL